MDWFLYDNRLRHERVKLRYSLLMQDANVYKIKLNK